MIGKNYIFQITFQGTTTVVNPVNDDFVLERTKEGEEVFFRKVVTTQFLFCKDDFNLLWQIENSCDRCELIQFDIIRKCSTGNFNVFTGDFNLNDADFDELNCSVSIAPTSYDDYTCLFETWDEEQNVLNGTTKQQFGFFLGTIECQTCIETGINTTFPDSLIPQAQCTPPLDSTWALTRKEITNAVLLGSQIYQVTNGTATSTYCREFVAGTVQPSGSNWQAVTGGFARPLTVDYSYINSTIFYSPGTQILEQDYFITGYQNNTIAEPIDNGVLLSDILEKLNDCGYTIKSNFFGINPDGTNPTNQAYDFAFSNLQDLIWFQKSDIKNPYAQNNATIADLSLKDLLESLKNMFNVKWEIQNNQFCIEHITYFNAVQGQDISNLTSIQGKRKYSYRSEELPQYEVFNWMDNVSVYFNGSRIIYNGFCVKKGEKKEYPVENVTTDFTYIQNNPDQIDDNGFFVLAAIEYNGSYYIENDNKALSWTELHENLWRWNRPQLEGNMNGTNTTFETAIRLKQQEELEFRLCCEDLEQFDPKNLIKTNLGWAEILKATFSAKSNCIKIDPVHESNC